ncbi:MAG: hypothetical protein OXH52_12330 [Gammaproteobacteria bacterium]|nr:hypothetical protein [Gammaproteobacteria bacterium]
MSSSRKDDDASHLPAAADAAERPPKPVSGSLEPRRDEPVLDLGRMGKVDLSHLSPEARAALLEQYAKGRIDLDLRARELDVDIQALDTELTSWTGQAAKAHEDGLSVTVSNATETSVGRTEVMIGNSEAAQKGRLSRNQTGEENWGPIIAIVSIIAGALLLGAIFG